MTGTGDDAAWRAAGLLDDVGPGGEPERRALLAWLGGQGCTIQEMAQAHAAGRLFALAGDRIVRPPAVRRSAAQVAAELGTDEARILRLWSALGLPPPVGDVLDDDDAEALRTALVVTDLMGLDPGVALVRVLGAGLGRLADAESSAMRGVHGVDLGRTHSELETAQVWQAVAGLVPRIGRVLDVVHRRHIDAARRHWETVLDVDGTVRSGVGFADLSGFTALSQRAPLPELAGLLSTFDDCTAELVHAGGGRVVKFIGDAVMFEATTPDALVGVAHALVSAPTWERSGLQLRAAVAAGELVAQEGDWYGPPVNLAARLVGVARPGQLLAAADPAMRVSAAWTTSAMEPVALRGFDAPVVAYDVRPALP